MRDTYNDAVKKDRSIRKKDRVKINISLVMERKIIDDFPSKK